MNRRNYMKVLPTALAAATGAIYLGAKTFPASAQTTSGVTAEAVLATPPESTISSAIINAIAPKTHASTVAQSVQTALEAVGSGVRTLSHPRALEDAFDSYFAFKNAHADRVKKPYLY